MKLSILHRYTLVCLTALINCACSSEPEPAPTTNGSSTTNPTGGSSTTSGLQYCDPTPIMVEACSGVVCHGSVGKAPFSGTDLFNAPTGQTLGQSLINKPANYNLVADPTSCPQATPELLINPGAPSESLILKKIIGTQACGVKMPNVTNGDLTQAEIDCFVNWVNGVITESGGTVTTGGTPTVSAATTASTTGGGTTTGGTTTGTVTTTGVATTTGTSTATATSTTGGPPPATWDTLRYAITYSSITCAGSDCHGGFEHRLDLRDDLTTNGQALYDQLTTWTSELCGNKLVVNPGNPDQSAILDVLTTGCGAVAPNCVVGEECIPQMPFNCQPGFDCVPDDKIEAIRQWIADGAVGPQ